MYEYQRMMGFFHTAWQSAIGGGIFGLVLSGSMCLMDDNCYMQSDNYVVFVLASCIAGAVLFGIIPLLLSGLYGILYLLGQKNG